MDNYRLNSMHVYVEKGLQSQNLADVLTTITECARYIRDYPFPSFVHHTLLRLAQAFQGDVFARRFEHSMNIIRLRIVTCIRECVGRLNISFSLTDDITKAIMKVSHSTDEKARSLTLLLLASLAPLICEDKKVHNLVIESLDCTDESVELSAAIHAANELAKNSIPFSSLIVQKIAELFGQSQFSSNSNPMRADLFAIISNMRDLAMARKCVELGKALLDTSDDKMRQVVYCSLTHLASRGEDILPDQISLLLTELDKNIAGRKKRLVHSILQNLTELASHQPHWSGENVKKFRDYYANIAALESKGILCTWLHCLELLISSTGHGQQHCALLVESHPWSCLLGSASIVVRIFAIKLALNLHQNGQTSGQFRDQLLDAILRTLRHFIAHPKAGTRIVGRLRHEFLSLVSSFARSPKCSPEFAFSVCKSLLRAKLAGPSRDLFELLSVVSQSYWQDCREIVSSSLIKSIERTRDLAAVPPALFCLLLSTTPASLFDDDDHSPNNRRLSALADRLLGNQPEMNHWCLYLIARSALRFGQWRLVALPLLEKVRKSCENMETQSWMTGLLHMCRAQPTAFSVDQLGRFESDLQSAALNFKLLASTEKSQPFAFAADYVACLQSTVRAVRSILGTINVKLLTLVPSTGAKTSEFQRKSIVQSLALVRVSVEEARQQWVTLCAKSFDADAQTLLQAGLMIRMCLLLEQFLGILCEPRKEQKLSEVPIENLGELAKNNFRPSAQTQNFHALLNWARDQLLRLLSNPENDLLLNLKMLGQILRHLADFPVGLPRFFFQRVQSTSIKLIISPQASDGRGVFKVASADLLPMVVEGIIASSNSKPIESVCVVLALKRENAAPTEKKQSIQLEQGQNYFRAQFLLKIHQRTKISAKVWFVDGHTKKQWFDESDTVGLTVELLDGGSSGQAQQQQGTG